MENLCEHFAPTIGQISRPAIKQWDATFHTHDQPFPLSITQEDRPTHKSCDHHYYHHYHKSHQRKLQQKHPLGLSLKPSVDQSVGQSICLSVSLCERLSGDGLELEVCAG